MSQVMGEYITGIHNIPGPPPGSGLTVQYTIPLALCVAVAPNQSLLFLGTQQLRSLPVSLCCPGHSRERRGRSQSQSQSQSQPQKAQIDRRMDLRGHGWMDGRFDLLRLMHDLFWRFLVRRILLPLLLFALLLARSLHRWRYAVFAT